VAPASHCAVHCCRRGQHVTEISHIRSTKALHGHAHHRCRKWPDRGTQGAFGGVWDGARWINTLWRTYLEYPAATTSASRSDSRALPSGGGYSPQGGLTDLAAKAALTTAEIQCQAAGARSVGR
jgi:hypothetical protein